MSLKNWFSGATSDAENAGSRPVEVQAAELNQLKADMQASVQENETLAAENKKLKTEKADTEAQLAEAQQTIAAHEATIDSQKAKIDELEKKPAAASTTVKKNEDVSQSDEDPTYQSVDRSWNEKANKALGF